MWCVVLVHTGSKSNVRQDTQNCVLFDTQLLIVYFQKNILSMYILGYISTQTAEIGVRETLINIL